MTKKKSSKSPRTLKICKDRDYDCVYVNGKKIMLGRSGTPEANAAYLDLQKRWFVDPTLSSLKPQRATVDDLCLAYLRFAEVDDPSHFSSIRTAVKILLANFAGQAADSLDSRSFLILQEKFVEHKVSRRYCNSLMVHIRAMLKWGAVRKLVSSLVLSEAKLVSALRQGKTKARENPDREDVPDEVVDMTLPYLLPTLRDMVRVQRLASMRPSEVCRMKPGEIDREYTAPDGTVVWMYTPGTNKNSWREKRRNKEYVRIIPLGKPEQDIIAPRLVGKSDDDHVFSPKDAMREHYAERAAKRQSRVQPSQVKRKARNAKNPKRRDRDHYDKRSYLGAISRSIKNANKRLPVGEQIPHWTPYQLRHAGVTETILQAALEIARATAGHQSTAVTELYHHADVRIATELAAQRSK